MGQVLYLFGAVLALAESATAKSTSTEVESQSTTVSASASASASATPTFEAGIPSTDGNPFIHSTKLPEGTLFIIFGSILLAIIVALILWRVTSVLMMRRSIKRGGQFQTLENTYGGPFVDPVADGDGTELPPVLDKKAEARSRDRKIRQSMFFSPTAQVMNSGNVSQPLVASSYLPAGYYSQPQTSDSGASSRRPFSVAGSSLRPPSVVTASQGSQGSQLANQPVNQSQTTSRRRPPSMMLDELIRGVE